MLFRRRHLLISSSSWIRIPTYGFWKDSIQTTAGYCGLQISLELFWNSWLKGWKISSKWSVARSVQLCLLFLKSLLGWKLRFDSRAKCRSRMILRRKCSGFKGVIKVVERENKEKKLAPGWLKQHFELCSKRQHRNGAHLGSNVTSNKVVGFFRWETLWHLCRLIGMIQ